MKISKITSRQILDSRGIPTIECSIVLDNNKIVKASVPSGASVGKLEALELRDSDKHQFLGKSVLKAIDNIEKIIAPKLIGLQPDILAIDKILIDLDGTENKSNLGANAILAVSLAVARANALMENLLLYKFISKVYGSKEVKIPQVMFNILNGGVHAKNGILFQEFMIMPIKQKSFIQVLNMAVTIHYNLQKLLLDKNLCVGVGDEGGFAPRFGKSEDIVKKSLDFLCKAVDISGFTLGQDVVFCLDVAASQFYSEKNDTYLLNDKEIKKEELIEYYSSLISDYPIYSIEDGLYEQDWDGWKSLTDILGSKVQLVGDDIFVTNPKLIEKGIKDNIANAVLIKPNQIGTFTQTLQAIKIAQDAEYKCVISHRSGETNDSFISDFVVGAGVGQFKAGAPCRGERIAKYNRLLEIEEEL